MIILTMFTNLFVFFRISETFGSSCWDRTRLAHSSQMFVGMRNLTENARSQGLTSFPESSVRVLDDKCVSFEMRPWHLTILTLRLPESKHWGDWGWRGGQTESEL